MTISLPLDVAAYLPFIVTVPSAPGIADFRSTMPGPSDFLPLPPSPSFPDWMPTAPPFAVGGDDRRICIWVVADGDGATHPSAACLLDIASLTAVVDAVASIAARARLIAALGPVGDDRNSTASGQRARGFNRYRPAHAAVAGWRYGASGKALCRAKSPVAGRGVDITACRADRSHIAVERNVAVRADDPNRAAAPSRGAGADGAPDAALCSSVAAISRATLPSGCAAAVGGNQLGCYCPDARPDTDLSHRRRRCR